MAVAVSNIGFVSDDEHPIPLPEPWLPVPVSKLEIAFPATVLHLMPDVDAIPEEFWRSSNEWARIASSWFSAGLPANVEFHMADGVGGQQMFEHLSCILGSYQPKHQHKIASVAFLLSKWCTKIENWEQPVDHCDPATGYHSTPHRRCVLR